MSIVFIGYKCGMTSFFSNDGVVSPATVIKVYSNYIVDIKSLDDSMSLLKISACPISKKKISRSIVGFYNKIGLDCFKYMLESKVESSKITDFKVGDILPLSFFNVLDKIDVIGLTKGRGFAGVIKRHNFKAQPFSHGNSLSHRAPGSIGQCQTPGRVFKGKKMPGRMGNVRVTSKNISVLDVYNDLNVVLLKGSVPGFTGNRVFLRKNF
ncbi:50S ribosomal protein L3 [Candidatus Azoamicus ciliaticola]|uniref:50S ribosomal protein L3 n=1 Tax=Candidatus Azoamicus ciliaticola TaxID=2652803 RepID=A0A6J5JYZ5_9GAMM|nr:50S ribosomal protein L3 [Candidatus Azoamicus ciliaticola]CAB3976329.1 50S ribosomal protein L3 [Candidatus Azoamicus ciliaticola]